MVCPLNAAFNRAAAYASLDQPRLMRPSHAVGSCSQSLAPCYPNLFTITGGDNGKLS
jgi:hypothetical protein